MKERTKAYLIQKVQRDTIADEIVKIFIANNVTISGAKWILEHVERKITNETQVQIAPFSDKATITSGESE